MAWALFRELSEDHVTATSDGLRIEAPTLATHLHVDEAWLESQLGAWSSDTEFVRHVDGMIEFALTTVVVRSFVPDQSLQFTYGSPVSIQIPGQPVWVNWTGLDLGELEIEFNAAEPLESVVLIANSALRALGIHRPNITLSDGQPVPWTYVQRINGTIEAVGGTDVDPDDILIQIDPDRLPVDVPQPYGAMVLIRPADIDVRGRVNGMFVPPDHYEYTPSLQRLDVEVEQKLSSYEVWVEKAWVQVNLPNVGVPAFKWYFDEDGGRAYYVVKLVEGDTGTTVRFEEFKVGAEPTYTLGHRSTIQTHAFNDTIRIANGPIFMSAPDDPNEVWFEFGGSRLDERSIRINKTFLASRGIDLPAFFNATNNSLTAALSVDEQYYVVDLGLDGEVHVVGNSSAMYYLAERTTLLVRYDNRTDLFHVEKPAYLPWASANGFYVRLYEFPWGEHLQNSTHPLDRVEVRAGNSTLATLTPNREISRISAEAAAMAASGSPVTFEPLGGPTNDPERIGVGPLPANPFSEVPEIAGIDTQELFDESGCTTQPGTGVYSDFNLRRSSALGNEVRQSEQDLVAAGQFEDWSYHSCFGEPKTVENIHMGFSARGRSDVSGAGGFDIRYTMWYNSKMEWDANPDPYQARSGYEIWSGDPIYLMWEPEEIDMSFENIGLSEGKRNHQCELEEDSEVWIAIGLKVIADALAVWNPYAYPLSLVIPDQECTTVVDPYTTTKDGRTLAGGAVNDVASGNSIGRTGAFALWNIESNPPSDQHVSWTIQARAEFVYHGDFRYCGTCSPNSFNYIVHHQQWHAGNLRHAS